MLEEIKPREAAVILGCSKSTLYGWVKAGKISHYRKGGRILFTRADIGSAYKFFPATAG